MFDTLFGRDRPIRGHGLVLRAPRRGDHKAWAQLRDESRAFLEPWEPAWPAGDLTVQAWRRRLERYRLEARKGRARTWFIFREADGELLGGVSATAIRYGASRSCQIGYWMGARHAGHGHMRRALPIVLAELFNALALERVEAACVPENERSQGLLQAVGFTQEGVVRSYLEIAGRRRDHILFSMLREEFERHKRAELTAATFERARHTR